MSSLSMISIFLLKALFGQNVDFSNADSIVLECIKKAYRDMLTGGRFVRASLDEKQIILILKLLKEKDFVFSRKDIEYVASLLNTNSPFIEYGNRKASTFGLAQKVINMTYKYFYVVHSLIPELFNINYSLCDCPIDSVVLNSINYYVVPWTRLSKEQYLNIQAIIENKSLQSGCNKLEYDFLVW